MAELLLDAAGRRRSRRRDSTWDVRRATGRALPRRPTDRVGDRRRDARRRGRRPRAPARPHPRAVARLGYGFMRRLRRARPTWTTVAARCLFVAARAAAAAEVGMDERAWEQLQPWLDLRLKLPVGPVFRVITDPRADERG
jgi:hypothetical protein